MKTRTATLRLQLLDAVSGPAKKSSIALKELEASLLKMGRNGAPGAKNLVNQLEHLRQKSAALGRFQELRRGLADTAAQFSAARSRAKQLEEALAGVSKPTAKMRADLRTAQRAVEQASKAYRDQTQAVREARQSLEQYSLSSKTNVAQSQREVRSQIAQTIRKMRELQRETKQQAEEQRRQAQEAAARAKGSRGGGVSGGPTPTSVAVGAAGGALAHRSGSVGREALMSAIDFDREVQFRDALAGSSFSEADRVRLNTQAERIGYETRFTNADVVVAQRTILQAGVRNAEHIINALQPITDYALAMGITLEEAAETIRAASQIRKVPLEEVKEISNFVDSLVWMAKNAGMNDDDVRQYVRYGGGSMKALGISDEVASAMGIVLRRSGIRGDEAGVFARTAAAKLGAPTNPGRLALNTMGLNYDDYVTNPEAFKTEGLAKMLRENFGIRLSKAVIDQIDEYINDAEFFDEYTGENLPVAADRGAFTSGIIELLQREMGEFSATDRKNIAKKIGDFHKFSAESVDSERLLMDILKANPSVAQLNAFFTQRQGNRALMIASNLEAFMEAVELMKNTPEGLSRQIGTDANKGLYGDWTRATGAIETALIKVVKDWEQPISAVLKSVDYVASEFTQLGDTTRRVIEAMAGLAVLGGGFMALRAGKGILGKLFGAAAGGAAGGAAARAGGSGPLSRRSGRGRGALKGVGALSALNLVFDAPSGKEEFLEYMRQNHAASDSLNSWLESIIGSPRTWFGLDEKDEKGVSLRDRLLKGAAADPDFNFRDHFRVNAGISREGRRRNALVNSLDADTASWPAAAQQAMQEYIRALATGGDQAEAEAAQIGEQIKAALSVTGEPDVNTSRLERALAVARQLAAVIRSELNGGPSKNVDGSAVVGGSRSSGGDVEAGKTYAVGGRGIELFTPGTDGHITPIGRGGSPAAPVQVNVHVNLGGVNIGTGSKQDLERLVSTLDRQLRRSSQIAFGNLRYGDA